jgi:hypothetical protein
MARIVMEYTLPIIGPNTRLDSSILSGPVREGGFVTFHSFYLPSFLFSSNSATRTIASNADFDGVAAPRSSTVFSTTDRYAPAPFGSSASVTTREIRYTGYDFSYADFPPVISTSPFAQNLLSGADILTGTVTSIEFAANYFTSSVLETYTERTKVTVTDIALPVTLIDPRNPETVFSRITVGNDQIFGSIAADTIDAGNGNDQVYGYDGNDTIYGGDGNDFLVGENGSDLLFGGNGTDWIIGGAGNDWIVGGEGYDTAKGGDSDDGVVFDAGDNLAEYDGGAGYDILFFTVGEDGSAPTYFSLSGHNFEQANGFRTDTKNQAWATNTNIYDAAWRMLSSEYVNDNGTKDLFRLDPTNAQNWNKIQSQFDASGKLDYEIIFYDDGSTKFLDFDLTNEAVWSSRVMLTNAAGVVTSDTFVLDTALAQRSSEMNQKKVFVSDALI